MMMKKEARDIVWIIRTHCEQEASVLVAEGNEDFRLLLWVFRHNLVVLKCFCFKILSGALILFIASQRRKIRTF